MATCYLHSLLFDWLGTYPFLAPILSFPQCFLIYHGSVLFLSWNLFYFSFYNTLLYQFPIAAVMNYRQVSALKPHYYLTILEISCTGLKWFHWQGWSPSRFRGKNPFLPFSHSRGHLRPLIHDPFLASFHPLALSLHLLLLTLILLSLSRKDTRDYMGPTDNLKAQI